MVTNGTPSDAGVAQRFVDSLYYQWLPPIYRFASVDMQVALTEYERAHDYQDGTATRKEAVESLCFLWLGKIYRYRNVAPILERFADHHTAIHEMARLNPLLPSSMVACKLQWNPMKITAAAVRAAQAPGSAQSTSRGAAASSQTVALVNTRTSSGMRSSQPATGWPSYGRVGPSASTLPQLQEEGRKPNQSRGNLRIQSALSLTTATVYKSMGSSVL